MKKLTPKIFAALIAVVIVVTIAVMVVHNYSKSEPLKVSKETVEDIVKSIYTPKSMKEFNEAKQKYEGTIMTKEVADELYHTTATELTEADLKRTVSMRVDYSSLQDNSIKDDLYRVTMQLNYSGKTTKAELVFFVNNEGQIYKVSTTAL